MKRLACLLGLLAMPAVAQTAKEDRAAFVDANVISLFYHETGHALIDVMELAVLGREEDAADTLSAILIHELWEEEAATELTYATAVTFLAFAAEQGDGDVAYWGVHGTDEQRYFNLVCLFYGGNPDVRADVAEELSLPAERAETCPDEYELAADSWGATLDELANSSNDKGLRLISDPDDPIAQVLAAEIEAINDVYPLPEWVDVEVAECGVVNAYYDPQLRRITICREFAAYIGDIFDAP